MGIMKTMNYASGQGKVLRLLASGGKYSAYDISILSHMCDPRSAIAKLRKKGFAIDDEWHTTVTNVRFKKYFIKRGTKL